MVGGVFLPKDGQANPIDTTQAFAKGARQRGAQDRREHQGHAHPGRAGQGGRRRDRRRARSLRRQRRARRRHVVARAGGAPSASSVPLHAAEHFYIVTEPHRRGAAQPAGAAGAPTNAPTTRRTPASCWSAPSSPWPSPGAWTASPRTFCFDTPARGHGSFRADPRRAPSRACRSWQPPASRLFFNGPESFTPDDRYYLGESAEVRDLFVATGFNSIGIQSSGGAGKVLAEWIRDRRIRRWTSPTSTSAACIPFQCNRSYLRDRTTETLGLLYAMHWPYRQYATARGVRRSPFHDRLVAPAPCMGEVGGLGAARTGTRRAGVEPEYRLLLRPAELVRALRPRECRAVRDAVALFDQSSFAKFLVEGRDACAVLNRISAADIDVRAGPDRLHAMAATSAAASRPTSPSPAWPRPASSSSPVPPSQTRDLAWLQRHIAGRGPLHRDRHHLGPADARR